MTTAADSNFVATTAPAARREWFVSLALNALILAAIVGCCFAGRVVEDPARVDAYRATVYLQLGVYLTLAVSLQLINGIAGQFSLGHFGFMAIGAFLGGYATLTYGSTTNADGDAVNFARPIAVLMFFVSLSLVVAAAGAMVAMLWFLGSRLARLSPALPRLMIVLLVGWACADLLLASLPAWPLHFWSHLATGLAMLFGWLCEHCTKASSAWLPTVWRQPLTMFFAVLGGGVMAGVGGVLVGLPTLRLRGDYLAIATLGFGEIIRVAITNCQPLGGATGLSVPPYANAADPDSNVPPHYIFPWVFGLAIVTTVVVWRLKYSPKGRAIQAVRDDEIAAAAMGVDPTHHKVLAFVIGAFFAGCAGAVWAHLIGYLNPSEYGFMQSIEVVVMVTIGGLGSIPGAIIAAAALRMLNELLRSPQSWIALAIGRPQDQLHLPAWLVRTLAEISDHRMAFFGLLLIAIMLLRSRGWFTVRGRRLRAAKIREMPTTTGAPA